MVLSSLYLDHCADQVERVTRAYMRMTPRAFIELSGLEKAIAAYLALRVDGDYAQAAAAAAGGDSVVSSDGTEAIGAITCEADGGQH